MLPATISLCTRFRVRLLKNCDFLSVLSEGCDFKVSQGFTAKRLATSLRTGCGVGVVGCLLEILSFLVFRFFFQLAFVFFFLFLR